MKLNRDLLFREYVINHRSDREIAAMLGVDRTTVVQARKQYGIPTRRSTGKIGEQLLVKELRKRGFSVRNMNEISGTFPFDLLVDHFIRIEVKSSRVFRDMCGDKFTFTLSEKPQCPNVESRFRIRLRCGRTRKLFRKTCDFLVLVGISRDYGNQFFIIPSEDIPDEQTTISLPADPSANTKYAKYRNRWDLLK